MRFDQIIINVSSWCLIWGLTFTFSSPLQELSGAVTRQQPTFSVLADEISHWWVHSELPSCSMRSRLWSHLTLKRTLWVWLGRYYYCLASFYRWCKWGCRWVERSAQITQVVGGVLWTLERSDCAGNHWTQRAPSHHSPVSTFLRVTIISCLGYCASFITSLPTCTLTLLTVTSHLEARVML